MSAKDAFKNADKDATGAADAARNATDVTDVTDATGAADATRNATDANADESKDVEHDMTDEKPNRKTPAATAAPAHTPAPTDEADETTPQIEFSFTYDDDPADILSSDSAESGENEVQEAWETSDSAESDENRFPGTLETSDSEESGVGAGRNGDETPDSVESGVSANRNGGETSDTAESGATQGASASTDDAGDGIVVPDETNSVATEANARRINETLALADDEIRIGARIGAHGDPNELRHAERKYNAAVDGQIADRVLVKSYPNFSLNHATTTNRKSGRHVLDDVSMAFYAGRLYAVRVLPDEDDAEKRVTLMEVFGGFQNPTSGSAMTKSSQLIELEINELRGHRLGLVPQRFAVRGDLDAESNVLYAMNASGRTYLKPKPIAAREFLARVGFGEATSGRKVRDLPLAEQRRVAIARAISCESDVLILDEPTKGLEASDAREILDLLVSIAHSRDPKRAVIIVTSRPEVAARADETYSLND